VLLRFGDPRRKSGSESSPMVREHICSSTWQSIPEAKRRYNSTTVNFSQPSSMTLGDHSGGEAEVQLYCSSSTVYEARSNVVQPYSRIGLLLFIRHTQTVPTSHIYMPCLLGPLHACSVPACRRQAQARNRQGCMLKAGADVRRLPCSVDPFF
jgi:hypothetical protein